MRVRNRFSLGLGQLLGNSELRLRALLRPIHSVVWSGVALLLALPSCLVSFNDYPLGEPQADAVSSGGAGAGGSSSVRPVAGGATGGGATGGRSDASSPATVLLSPLVVDDFEDGNAAILEQQGRSGAWYVANDGRAMQTPREGMLLLPSSLNPPRGGSAHGAHTFGGPFPTWGALVGIPFASSGSQQVAYDLSGYDGVRLWVRSGTMAPGAATKVRFNLRTPATTNGSGCTICGDHFGADVPLTSQWAQIDVPLASLKQVGFGQPMLTTPDFTHAMGIDLLFVSGVSFDLWIDDVELY